MIFRRKGNRIGINISPSNKIANDIGSLVQTGTPEDLATGIAAVHALAPDTAPIVPQIQTAMTNLVFHAVGNRLSGATTINPQGTTAGDAEKSTAIWLQGLASQANFDKNAQLEKFQVNTSGVAVGAEKIFEQKLKLGVGLAYGKTDADTSGRDTKVKTYSLLAYGEYKPKKWFINGVLSFGRSKYQEDKNVVGNMVVAKYNIKTVGGQIMLGYDWRPLMVVAQHDGENAEEQKKQKYNWSPLQLVFMPAVGLRYAYINADDYLDTAGQDVVVGSRNIVTGILGAKIGATWKTEGGVSLIPEMKAAVTYEAKQARINSKVTLPNEESYSVSGNNLDKIGYEVGGSFTAGFNDHFAISASYMGKLLKDYTDHSGLIDLNYRF